MKGEAAASDMIIMTDSSANGARTGGAQPQPPPPPPRKSAVTALNHGRPVTVLATRDGEMEAETFLQPCREEDSLLIAEASEAMSPNGLPAKKVTMELRPLPASPSALRHSTNTLSSLDSELLERQREENRQQACSSHGPSALGRQKSMSKSSKGSIVQDTCDGFIAQIDKDGNIKQVPVKYSDTRRLAPVEDEAPNSITDFVSADLLTKPFNFVAGGAPKARFNPFRKKKSGILNVLAKQATRNRIVAKNGTLNTVRATDGKSHHFLKDIFITMIDLPWRWIFCVFATAFFSSWLFFACLWYLTFLAHGDFAEENRSNASFVPCATAIIDFTSCFLLSLETQHTIGYGVRATNEQCPVAIIVMCIQSIAGVIIQSCMAGIIFAKFTVPRNRGETIIFSKNAVISMRNGSLYLMCRVSDLRKAGLLEAHVRMIVIKKEKTEEGEVIPYQMRDLDCGSEVDGSNDRVLVLWPVTISHRVDKDSPFYEYTPREFLTSNFEIIVTLEGITEETGNTVQARTSYLPNEILWGHHFESAVVAYDKKNGVYSVMHNIINKTVVDQTPRYSAIQLAARNRKRKGKKEGGVSSSSSSSSSASNSRNSSSCGREAAGAASLSGAAAVAMPAFFTLEQNR